MSDYGFRLVRLSLTGRGLIDATITFSKGLNIIYGPSDTGKTFIVQCIDFIFGGKKAPKPIPEANGYEIISLVITPWASSEEFKLTRSIKGGGIKLYAQGFPSRMLSEKHSEKNEDSVSRFLLKLSNLDGKRVRKTAYGQTDSLSFRDLAKLIVIDEEEVIGERSPYLSGQSVTATKEKSVFKFLLTGVDDSEIVAIDDPKTSKIRKAAKIEVIKQLCDESTRELIRMEFWPDKSAVTQSVSDIAIELERLKVMLSSEQDALNVLETKRQSLWEDHKRAQSKIAVLSELRTRFALLRDQYNSDLSRLEAISEAGFRLAQMPMERCPVCGALPEYHQNDHQKDKPPEELAISCEMEASKIRVLIEDLIETNESNNIQIKIKNDNAQRIYAEFIDVDKIIDDELQPRFQALAVRINELTDKQPIFLRALYLYNCIDDFRILIKDLENLKTQKSDKDAFSNISASQTEEFCKEVEAILREWKFPGLDRVTFSQSDDDIIISGQERASHGKGVRAITHTAFNLALLQFCKNRSMPHPGLIVVDSPLVVYRQADPDFDPKDKDFSPDVKEAFYRSLSNHKNIQVVICENDDPPADLSANLIRFTKTDEERYGFIPRNVKEAR